MSFLTPWILYGLGAISLPILIHLWQRRRVVEIPIGTLRFLKTIAAKTSRNSKIENLLLLLLRCLLFVLVILAAARPVMLAKTAEIFGGEMPRTIVIIIDNSMSMGYSAAGQSRLETAKACARVLLDDLKQGDRVAIIAGSDQARLLIAEPTIDRAVIRQTIDEIRPTESRSDFGVALLEAGKIVACAERGVRQVFVFSDNQETGWQKTASNPSAVFDTTWQQSAPQLIIVRPDEIQPVNATVKEIRIDSPFLQPGGIIRGTAIVENFSSAPLHDLLKISIGTERLTQKPVEVPPGGTVEIGFEFQAPMVTTRWVKGSASLSGDHLPQDDQFYFTLPVYQPPHALIAEGFTAGPERLRPGYYLRKALAAGLDNAIQSRSIGIPQLDETDLEDESIVFLLNPGRVSDRAAVRLERFLESGGTVAIFPGDQTQDLGSLSFLPGKSIGLRNLAAGRQPVRIAVPNHPLFADAWDTGTPFPALPQQRLLDWNLSGNAQPLLTIGSSNSAATFPFLIYGERGAGRCLVINASADRSWGDFPLSPAFVPLVQQIARLSASQGGHSPRLFVGDSLPFPPILPWDKPITLNLPDGSKRSLPARNDAGDRMLIDRTESAGIYESAAGKVQAAIAVNIDRAESNLHPISSNAFEKFAPASEIFQVTGPDGLRRWLAESKGMAPIWPLLLVAALAVFALESLLSNLIARKRSQGDEKHIAIGRLNRRRMGVPFYEANPKATTGDTGS